MCWLQVEVYPQFTFVQVRMNRMLECSYVAGISFTDCQCTPHHTRPQAGVLYIATSCTLRTTGNYNMFLWCMCHCTAQCVYCFVVGVVYCYVNLRTVCCQYKHTLIFSTCQPTVCCWINTSSFSTCHKLLMEIRQIPHKLITL